MSTKKSKSNRSPKRRTIRMMVIPEPAPNTRSGIINIGPGTVVVRGQGKGMGNVTMVCGNCGSPLLENIKVSQFQSLVFLCNKCGVYNDTLV